MLFPRTKTVITMTQKSIFRILAGHSPITYPGGILVYDLSNEPNTFRRLRSGKFGEEKVTASQATEPHDHPDFLSCYKTQNLDVVCGGKDHYILPHKAAVLVAPGVVHQWLTAKGMEAGTVGSVDHRHGPQSVVPR
jgi:hypothetical protein